MKPLRHNARRGTGARDASALIVVLWVIGLLSILMGSFAFDAHVEARIISYYRKRTKADYLARSGLEMARMLMIKSEEMGVDEEGEEDDRWFQDGKRLKEGLPVEGMVEELGNGEIILSIVPEPARRNINRLGKNDTDIEENMERILEVGNVPEEMWPELIESFIDWIDQDDEPRFDGAETDDYYSTLEPPYEARNNALLDTVDELLLVKGFNRTILYGGVLKGEFGEDDEEAIPISGIADLLTTYGDGKVNINAAPMRVLMTLPEVDEIAAGAIIEEREGLLNPEGDEEFDPFRSGNDLLGRIPELDVMLKNYVTTDSRIYRITSVGHVANVEKVVWCIVEYANKDLRILRWREED